MITHLHDHHRYSSPAAHLYDVLDVPDGIRVNGRLARLVIARESGCLISWQTGRKTASYGGSNMYEPCVEVPLEKVARA
jgi:hypothetical protein